MLDLVLVFIPLGYLCQCHGQADQPEGPGPCTPLATGPIEPFLWSNASATRRPSRAALTPPRRDPKKPDAALEVLSVLGQRLRKTDVLLSQRVFGNAIEVIG